MERNSSSESFVASETDDGYLLGHKMKEGRLRRQKKSKYAVWIILGLAVTVSLSLSIVAFARSLHTVDSHRKSNILPQDEIWPTVPTVMTMFDQNKLFKSAGKDGDAAWEQLLPVGSGYVKVQDPRRYDIRPSVHLGDWEPRIKDPDPTAEVYSVAVVHQLHCLALLRAKLVAVTRDSHNDHSGSKAHTSHTDMSHLFHCLDYLRQSVTCCGDTALEDGIPTYDENGKMNDTIFSGRWTMHTCRNWDVIKTAMVEQRASDFASSIFD